MANDVNESHITVDDKQTVTTIAVKYYQRSTLAGTDKLSRETTHSLLMVSYGYFSCSFYIIAVIGGMFLEGTALQIMFVPLLFPIATAVGIDPVAFGVTIIMNIALGTMTPPVGVCVFVAASSGNVPFEDVVQAVMPFLTALIFNIILVIFIPQIITFVPQYFLK